MKRTIFSIVLFIFGFYINCHSQEKNLDEDLETEFSDRLGYSDIYEYGNANVNFDSLNNKLETTVITIDLSRPHKNSVIHSGGQKRLVLKNKNLLAINLINGNPFRYKYVLNYKKINLFNEKSFSINPSDTLSSPRDEFLNAYNTKEAGLDSTRISNALETIKNSLISQKESISNYILEISNVDKLDYDQLKFKRMAFKESLSIDINSIDYWHTQLVFYRNDDASKPEDISLFEDKFEELNTLADETNALLHKLQSIKSNSYLLPIDVNGDNIDFVEIILKRYDNDSEEPETFKYKIWLKGGLKIDVSAGGFITSLFDKDYTSTPVDSSDGESVIKENDLGNFDFGFGTLVNISLRGGSWVKPSLNFGTLLTSNQKFQILAGGGLILGKNQRWTVNAGLAMGRIDTINSNYTPDGETQYKLGNEGAVPTTEKFSFGHFFGVTYNLSPTKKKD